MFVNVDEVISNEERFVFGFYCSLLSSADADSRSTDIIVTQSILVLRSILRSKNFIPTSTATSRFTIISQLIDLMEDARIVTPSARDDVYWLVGQYAGEGLLEDGAPDLLRLGAKGFAEEVRRGPIIQICTSILKNCDICAERGRKTSSSHPFS